MFQPWLASLPGFKFYGCLVFWLCFVFDLSNQLDIIITVFVLYNVCFYLITYLLTISFCNSEFPFILKPKRGLACGYKFLGEIFFPSTQTMVKADKFPCCPTQHGRFILSLTLNGGHSSLCVGLLWDPPPLANLRLYLLSEF